MEKHEIRSFKIRKQDCDRLQSAEFVIGNMSVIVLEQPLLSLLPEKDGYVELLSQYLPCIPSHASIPDYKAYFVYTYKVDYFTSTPVVKTKIRLCDVPHYQSFSKYVLGQLDEYTKINGVYKTVEDVARMLAGTKEETSTKRHKVETPAMAFETEERVLENETFDIKHPVRLGGGSLEGGIPILMKEYVLKEDMATKVDRLLIIGDGKVEKIGDTAVVMTPHASWKSVYEVGIPNNEWKGWETTVVTGTGVVNIFAEQPNMMGVRNGMIGCRYTE